MKKGFTLVELLGIIVILGLVVVFTVPSIINSVKNSDDIEYENFTKTIIMAAETYYQSNKNVCDFDINEICTIDLKILINEKLISENLINPKTQKTVSMTDTVTLSKNSDNQIEYIYTSASE